MISTITSVLSNLKKKWRDTRQEYYVFDEEWRDTRQEYY